MLSIISSSSPSAPSAARSAKRLRRAAGRSSSSSSLSGEWKNTFRHPQRSLHHTSNLYDCYFSIIQSKGAFLVRFIFVSVKAGLALGRTLNRAGRDLQKGVVSDRLSLHQRLAFGPSGKNACENLDELILPCINLQHNRFYKLDTA